MAYCRWSCMNGYCQVYLYEDVSGGYTLHVASHKLPPGAPEHGLHLIIDKGFAAYKAQNALYEQWRSSVRLMPIEHEYAGQSYGLDEIAEVISLLTEMRAAGVVFPDHVLKILAAEALEAQQEDAG